MSDPTDPSPATPTQCEHGSPSPRLVRVCPVCGSRPVYSLTLKSEWIACPNGCLKTLVKGGAAPEWLENQWNLNCNMALASEVADTPFDEYFDANNQTTMKTGIELIADERARQISAEGWTLEHDDEHDQREMPRAAQCYLDHYIGRQWVIPTNPQNYINEPCPRNWPEEWSEDWWKPKGRIPDLVRAGALIAAEIDRLQRAGLE